MTTIWLRPRPQTRTLHAFIDGATKSACTHYLPTYHGVPVKPEAVTDADKASLCARCAKRVAQ